MTSQQGRMLAGELYGADDPELAADHARAAAWLDRYNRGSAFDAGARLGILREAFAAVVGAGAVVTRDVPAGRTAHGNPARRW